ncbi:UNVERIFIED_CONTAM: hypothetical protein FKN15_023364 [Acipenser sinensis]
MPQSQPGAEAACGLARFVLEDNYSDCAQQGTEKLHWNGITAQIRLRVMVSECECTVDSRGEGGQGVADTATGLVMAALQPSVQDSANLLNGLLQFHWNGITAQIRLRVMVSECECTGEGGVDGGVWSGGWIETVLENSTDGPSLHCLCQLTAEAREGRVLQTLPLDS